MDLVLNTFGTYLTKDHENFVVVHKDGKQKVLPEKVRHILVSKGAQISSDAALLALEHNIDVFFLDAVGNHAGRLWSMKYGSVSTIRHKQLDFTFSKAAVAWIKKILQDKIDNQIALIYSFDTQGDNEKTETVKKAVRKLNDYKTKIDSLQADLVTEIAPGLRGWEGNSSRIYFQTINRFIPEKYQFERRTQNPAMDVFNCLLNYGYGILYGKVETALIKSGIDPYIGVMHREDYNRPVLVFDVIEKFRVWVDYVVVNLSIQQVIDEDCYSVKTDGSYWLESMGRRILIQSINDYLDEVISMDGIQRSRLTHIDLYAQALAQRFLKI
jgi:CRISPR-associated protein Cas1